MLGDYSLARALQFQDPGGGGGVGGSMSVTVEAGRTDRQKFLYLILDIFKTPSLPIRMKPMCHASRVTSHMSHVKFFWREEGQSGGAIQWRVCYERGLPRLISFQIQLVIPSIR